MKTEISVVVATYDGEAFVRQTIESVLAQDHPSFELIVCDDGSRDRTPDIVRSFGARLTFVRQENQGVSAARNAGARLARGRFVAFLDQDDLWEPELLSVLGARLAEREDCAQVYADSWVIDGGGRRHGRRSEFLEYAEGEVFERLLRGNFVPIETSLFRRDAFDAVGGFDPRWRFLEDYDLELRLALRWPIAYVDRTLASYRIHDRNLSHDIVGILAEFVGLLDALPGRHPGLDAGARAVCAAELARRRGELAWQHLRRLELAAAKAEIEAAGAGCPRSLRWKNRIAWGLLSSLPAPLADRLVRLLPQRRLYGLRLEAPR